MGLFCFAPSMMPGQTSLRALVFLVMAMLAFSRSLLAEEPALKFKADLIYVTYPLQYIYDQAPKAVRCSSSVLQSPVFDVSPWMRKNGVKLPEGSEALFSPQAKLFYINSTEEDVAVANSFMGSSSGIGFISIDLRAAIKSRRNGDILLEAKSVPVPAIPRNIEFAVTGKTSLHLTLRPVVAPDGATVDTDVEAEAHSTGKSFKVTSTWTTHLAASEETTLGKLGDSVVTLRMKTRVVSESWDVEALSSKEKKAEAIKEIQQAREHDRRP